MDIVPERYQSALLESLVEDIVDRRQSRLSTGIIGTYGVRVALAKHRRADVFYLLATQTGYPSWGHQIENGVPR
jgi:alpha-L-rhamnosidase